MTGFESGDLNLFNSYNGVSITTSKARTGARSLLVPYNSSAKRLLPATISELYMRFGIYHNTSSGSGAIIKFIDPAGTVQCTFVWDMTNAKIAAYRGDKATLLAEWAGITSAEWHCIEIHLVVDDTNGVFEVKYDGTLVIDYDGDTKASSTAGVRTIQFSPVSGAGNSYNLDDIAINDTSGSRNNSWIGRGGIYVCKPNGVGTYSELTPSAGNNYECVDEVPPDDDTSYVQSNTVDKRDTYALENLSVGAGTISAICWQTRARLTEPGSGSIARLLRIENTDFEGDPITLEPSYNWFEEIIEENPITEQAWQISEINSLEAGVQVED